MHTEPVLFGLASLTPGRLLATALVCACVGVVLSWYERSLRRF